MWQVDAWRTALRTFNYRGWRSAMIVLKIFGYLMLLSFSLMLLAVAVNM